LPANLQRWTLKCLDEAYKAFFRRVKVGGKPGFPRFRGKGRFDTFGFGGFSGIRFENERIRFKGLPGSLRVHCHRTIPTDGSIRSCVIRREVKGWFIGFATQLPDALPSANDQVVGVDATGFRRSCAIGGMSAPIVAWQSIGISMLRGTS